MANTDGFATPDTLSVVRIQHTATVPAGENTDGVALPTTLSFVSIQHEGGGGANTVGEATAVGLGFAAQQHEGERGELFGDAFQAPQFIAASSVIWPTTIDSTVAPVSGRPFAVAPVPSPLIAVAPGL